MTTNPAFTEILQRQIPFAVAHRPLPGVSPLDPDDWIAPDEAYAAQMAYRTNLLDEKRADVLIRTDGAEPAIDDVWMTFLDLIARRPELGFSLNGVGIRRPDGQVVTIDHDDLLGTLGLLVQEDLCLMVKQGDAHVLTAAVLCFPASWTLSQKIGRPLVRIHAPVDSYDAQVAQRVQRLFDGVQPGRPLWRFNRLWYARADLHQPLPEGATRQKPEPGQQRFFRCEKQAILRLPRTRAVLFSIHTYVVAERDAPDTAFD